MTGDRSLRILIWGINFAPEQTGIAVYTTLLAKDLQERPDCSVRVLTGFPYYPEWRKRPEDRWVLGRREEREGICLQRSYVYVPRRVTGWQRMVHELSFVGLSWLRLLFGSRPDLVLVISPPLGMGVAARMLGWLRGIPYLVHVQDLQPDAAVGLGMLKPGLFTRFLYAMERFAYAGAWRVSGISAGMLRAFTEKGVPVEKQVYFPNPVTLPPAIGEMAVKQEAARHWKKKFGWPEDALLLVYAGNMGVKQGLGFIIEVMARLPENTALRLILCGDGADRPRLEEMAGAIPKTSLIGWLPVLPGEDYQRLLEGTDLALITQQAGSGAAFFPSKLLTAAAHGLPVLAVTDETSELGLAMREGDLGWLFSPDDPTALEQFLTRLPEGGNELGEKGRKAREWVGQFAEKSVLDRFYSLIREVAKQG